MEMQETPREKERVVEVDESQIILETSVEEAESTVYSKLKSPSEDIYAEASPGQPCAKDRPGTSGYNTVIILFIKFNQLNIFY
ncbi:unnamed protein product [Oncorhynchus mykiss]|uniref:Uncharacterized protein n=1 Tax=Oncorhynchus mykiss TaxID=8022 RepID=A0A060XSY2_ONCMY|nr:unnamed protein product [Oncorhynchus mykiss]